MAFPRVMVGSPLKSTGGVLTAPLGTAVPTDTKTTLNAAFKPLGLVGKDGVTMTPNRDNEGWDGWGEDDVRILSTKFGVEFDFELAETTNIEVVKAVHGERNVTDDLSGSKLIGIKHNIDMPDHMAWVFEMKDGDARRRIVVPNGQIVEVSERSFSASDVTTYKVKMKAFQDDNGNNVYEYIQDQGA
ncbi:phage tail tube protein [Dermabacteraceae bacterium P13077]